jgi:hypothetical protein
VFLSGSTEAQAGPKCRGHGRIDITGATGTSLVDNIIASHDLIGMASTVVHHDPNDPLMRTYNLTTVPSLCACSLLHAAVSPGRPTTARKVSHLVALDTLSHAETEGISGERSQPCPHVVAVHPGDQRSEAQMTSRTADSLSAGLVHAASLGTYEQGRTRPLCVPEAKITAWEFHRASRAR